MPKIGWTKVSWDEDICELIHNKVHHYESYHSDLKCLVALHTVYSVVPRTLHLTWHLTAALWLARKCPRRHVILLEFQVSTEATYIHTRWFAFPVLRARRAQTRHSSLHIASLQSFFLQPALACSRSHWKESSTRFIRCTSRPFSGAFKSTSMHFASN